MTVQDILQQLISISSISGNERKIQEWIFEYIKNIRLQPEWVGPNVVCKISGKDSSKCLIFNGHVDTVPSGDEKDWKYPSFTGEIHEGKMYGLGTSDMKSGDALMLKLAEIYSKIQPNYDLWFHFVVKEETDGSGTEEVMKWFAKKHKAQYKTLAVIIPEPTNLKEIVIAHKGNVFLKVTVKGDGGHGSTPELIKLHAISKMHKVARKLFSEVKSWQKKYRDEVLGIPTISWTSIQAGDMRSPNKIADTCVATFDIRTTSQVHDKVLGLLQKAISKSANIEVLYPPLPVGYTNISEHIVILAQKITGLPTGKTHGSTDLLFFTAMGIPGIILGPGENNMEHTVNEYVYLSKIEKCFIVFNNIIEQF